MKRLRDKIKIQCSAAETQRRIGAYFDALRGSDGVAHVRLRVALKAPMGALGLSIDREVRIDARTVRDDENINDVIRIHWDVDGSVAFPEFDGTLVAWGEDDPDGSYVEINGEYKPPLGGVGEAFDDAFGHKIAESTAREFLNDLKRAIEKKVTA